MAEKQFGDEIAHLAPRQLHCREQPDPDTYLCDLTRPFSVWEYCDRRVYLPASRRAVVLGFVVRFALSHPLRRLVALEVRSSFFS